MQDNDYEMQKALIYDESNVTDTNPLKELFKVAAQLVIVLAIVYFSIFAVSGIVIKTMTTSQQAKLENAIAGLAGKDDDIATEEEKERLDNIKDKILSTDKKFPRISKLKIGIVKNKNLNAWCYPNGKIYITDSLYKKLKDDEELTFVIGHEMGHYKNRDHLMALRKNLSSMAVIISTAIISPNGDILNIISGGIDASDLHYSKGVEMRADNYAKKALIKIYGNTNGGVRVLEIFEKEGKLHLSVLSDHPDIRKRIKNLKK